MLKHFIDCERYSRQVFLAYYNFVWRTRHDDQSGRAGQLRPTAAMMAGVTNRLWTFEDLFNEAM